MAEQTEHTQEFLEVEDGDLSAILDATLAFSQTQLLAQIADETSLDGRTMGVLGFNGALVAADVAAKSILGHWWWVPLPFVLIAAVLCARSVFAKDTYLGPKALTFFATYGGQTSKLARETLLADLDVAYQQNAERAQEKTKNLRGAIVALSAGLIVAGALITFDGSAKLKPHACQRATRTAACAASAGPRASAVGSAPSGPTRH